MAVEYLVDGLSVRLRAPHDLSWLGRFGQVFCVFDQLISGNLCFGVQEGHQRYFIKYAGAPTLGHPGDPALAVKRLQAADERYERLSHPAFTRRLESFETRGGFGLVFAWFEGFALAPLESQMISLRALPYAQRFALFDSLADFITLASRQDYVTAGIADRNILVDFKGPAAIFCSADHFIPMPAVNTRGRLSGSPWFLAPETYVRGARLEESANVWQMGMLAHTFFGNRISPNQTQWEATTELYAVAQKALQEDPARRYPLAEQFLSAWRQGVMAVPGHWFMR